MLTDVKFKIVADINRKGENARVVSNPTTTTENKPRVDIKTEVETFGAGGKATTSQGTKAVGNSGGSVSVGKGGGVLGHLLTQATPPAEIPDTTKMSNAELKKALEPYFGHAVAVTT